MQEVCEQTTDKDYEPEDVWQKFWKEICSNPDGSINIEQVKKELCDFYMLLEFVPKVYCAVTGDRISKPNTLPDAVIEQFESYVDRLIAEAKEEAAEDVLLKLL